MTEHPIDFIKRLVGRADEPDNEAEVKARAMIDEMVDVTAFEHQALARIRLRQEASVCRELQARYENLVNATRQYERPQPVIYPEFVTITGLDQGIQAELWCRDQVFHYVYPPPELLRLHLRAEAICNRVYNNWRTKMLQFNDNSEWRSHK